MQLVVQKKGYRILPFLALALAVAVLVFIASDTRATHNDGELELDGNPAYDGGFGVNPNSGPGDETKCGPAGVSASVDPPSPPDCITTQAAYDWADDSPNVISGDQGVCKAGVDDPATDGVDETNVITENLDTPKGDLRDCIPDFVVASTADTSYHTGSDKDFQEIWNGGPDDWGCVRLNNATSKADLLNAYTVQVTPDSGPSEGDQLLFFGAERDVEHGTVFNGFWFLQDSVSSDCPPSTDGDFCPTTSGVDSAAAGCSNPGIHECGDVLILFNYESGGRVGRVAAYNWQPGLLGCDETLTPEDGAGLGSCYDLIDNGPDGLTDAADPDCQQGLDNDCPNPDSGETHDPLCLIREIAPIPGDCRLQASTDFLCGRVNGATDCQTTNQRPVPCFGPGEVTTPWAPGCETPGINCEGPLQPPTFSEAGVNLTGLGIQIPCVSTFVAETRSSSAVTATLKDFAIGEFPPCALSWEKRDESQLVNNEHPLQGGATFDISPNPFACSGGANPSPISDDADGVTSATDVDKDADAGQLSLPDVCPGTYSICENSAPTGYARDDVLCRSIEVSTAETNAVIGTQGVDDCDNATPDEQDFCNRLGSIEWEKRSDIDGELVGGATFTVGDCTPEPPATNCNGDGFGPFACQDADDTGADDDNPVTVVDDVDPALPDTNLIDQDEDAGQFLLERVCLGNYTITETVAPPGFDPDPDPTRTCSVDDPTIPGGTDELNCVVGTQGEPDSCPDEDDDTDTEEEDFCNVVGSLVIRKETKDASTVATNDLLGGACFTISPDPLDGDGDLDVCDDAAGVDQYATDGMICLDDVAFGEYTVTEKTAPANYVKDATPQDADISVSSTCASRATAAGSEADVPPDAGPFVNTPLSRFEIKFICLAPSPSDSTKCATQAQISCEVPAVDGGTGDTDPGEDGDPDNSGPLGAPVFDDLDEYFGDGTTGLEPGEYDCTINIDP